MTSSATALILALVAAACFGAAAVVQHRAVGAVVAGEAAGPGEAGEASSWLSLRRVRDLLRDPSWLLGAALALAGVGLHVVALSMAPLSVVQPVGVLAIPVAVLLVLLPDRRRPGRGVVAGVGLTLLGVGAVVLLAAPTAAGAPALGGSLVVAVVGTALAVAALAAVSVRQRGALRPLGLVAAGAVSFGLVSLLVRTVAPQLVDGRLAPLDPPVLAVAATVAVAALAGTWLVQQGLATGPPELALAVLTVVDPVVAITLSALLGDGPPGSGTWAAVGVAAAVGGITVLARSHPSVTARGQAVPGRLDLRAARPDAPSSSGGATRRVLVGVDTYPPDVNGAARFAHRLATGLAERGHDVHVVAPSATGAAGTERVGRVTVHRLVSHRLPGDTGLRVCLPWTTRAPVAALVERIDPDVVHVQSHFPVGRALVAAANRTGRAVVATNHAVPANLLHHTGLPAPLRPVFSAWFWGDLARALARAQVVTAPTPRAVKMLTDAGVVGGVAVSCGIDTTRPRAARAASTVAQGAPGGVPTVLFVGRLDREKHVDELVRAFAALPDDVPARLEVVGQGPRRAAWTALAQDLGVGARVDFRGFVTDEELDAAYAGATVFVMPGTAELQSLVTLEAMAAGLPVVAADAMALPHLVRPGVTGWLYPPGRPEALAGRLADLLVDPEQRAAMGEAGRRAVADHALDTTLATFEDLYGRALAAVTGTASGLAPAPTGPQALSATTRSSSPSSTAAERSQV